ncbi:hypothetical protein BH20GEM1_BH20GEM1_00690 [soil metagenome]
MKCPECGHDQVTVVWRTIDGGLDPELRDLLVDGELNVFRCDVCAIQGFFTPGPILYFDSARRYAVQYYPPAILKHDALMLHTFDGEGRVAQIELSEDEGWYDPDAHVVFDFKEMIRYIQFRERLHTLMELPVAVPVPYGLPELDFGSPHVSG